MRLKKTTHALSVVRLLMLSLLFVAGACSRASAGEPFLRGDVDSSGALEITDATRIFGFLFLGDPAAIGCEDRADSNDDGELEITDGLTILHFLFRGGRPLPPPGRQSHGLFGFFFLPGYDVRVDDPFPCGDPVLVGGERPVAVYEPAGHDLSGPLPLLLFLHGFGERGDVYEHVMQLRALADERGFLYATPDGTRGCGGTFWSATDACCDFEGLSVGREESADDSSYLRGVIEEIEALYTVDPRRIFVAGHSNGGFMSYRMACDHADKVRGIVSLAGMTYLDEERCRPVSPVHVLNIHGSSDGTVRPGGGTVRSCNTSGALHPSATQTVESWARYNGCPPGGVDAVPIDVADYLEGDETSVVQYSDGCASGGSAEFWLVEGGEHQVFSPSPVTLPLERNTLLWPAILDWLWEKTSAPSFVDVAFDVSTLEGDEPLEVEVDAGASSTTADALVSYAWDFGDGSTADGVAARHTYTRPGVYRLELVVTDSLGTERRRRARVVVYLRSEPAPPWQSAVVGEVDGAGGARFEGDCLLVAGAVGAVSGTADRFDYVHQPVAGDNRLTVRLEDWTTVKRGSRIGLMLRESLDPDARNATILLENTADGFIHQFSRRERRITRIVEHETYETSDVWLEIERQGDQIRTRLSPDGDTWTAPDEVTLEGLPEEIFFGIVAVGSEDDPGVATLCELNLVAE